ncbi:MAG: 2-C-methyl-D-erythritol 4-phosphate cytidylyltransferase [Rhodanobacter sp.]
MSGAPLWCIVPAAGRGLRAGGGCPKQYRLLAGQPLLWHTLQRLARHPRIFGMVVVLAAGDTQWPGWTTMCDKPIMRTIGGSERSDSVLAGLDALAASLGADDHVLVHDAARPCVRADDITRLLEAAHDADGALLGARLRDTLKCADADGRVVRTEPRELRWRAFTPQLFRFGPLRAALRAAAADGVIVGDEAMAMERAGFSPRLVEGAEDNIKVTTPADFALAEFLLARTA